MVWEIYKLVEDLDVRKASRPDVMFNWLLREYKDQLEGKIHSIIECSLKEEKAPHEFKMVPIFKGGNIEKPSNYRPVCLTRVMAKSRKIKLKGRWMTYMEENYPLTGNHLGLRNGRSCIWNLMSIY